VAIGTFWQQTQAHGQRLLETSQRQQQQVSLERTAWENRRYAPQRRKAVSMDGGMVHVRGEGWKELKVGLVADVPSVGFAKDEQVHLSKMRYCGVLGDVTAFEPALWALAVEHDIPYAGFVVVTADGAAWIWRLADNYFPCAVQVVDWYHACQHLAEAAQARFPDYPSAVQRWTDDLKAHLFKGEIHLIREQFNRYGLADYGDYFEEHARRMQYAQFRAAGFPIGSGGVESGVKQFKQIKAKSSKFLSPQQAAMCYGISPGGTDFALHGARQAARNVPANDSKAIPAETLVSKSVSRALNRYTPI
jgi:hypothetical protein